MDIDQLIDHARLARHEKLIEIWHDLPSEELLIDLSVLAQMAAFRQRQELILIRAQVEHANGATHECSEWKGTDNRCQLCGRSI